MKLTFSIFLVILGWLIAPDTAIAQTTNPCLPQVDDDTPKIYCKELYPALDPWQQSQFSISNGPRIGNERTSLKWSRTLTDSSRSFMKPVGRLSILFQGKNDSSFEYAGWCTASILSDDYIITAAHCIDQGHSRATKAYIRLNYTNPNQEEITKAYDVISDPSGCQELNWEDAKWVCPMAGNYGFGADDGDFVILRIDNPVNRSQVEEFADLVVGPTALFGALRIELSGPAGIGQEVIVPQHPISYPQAYSYGVIVGHFNGILQHSASTFTMSSGAPVLRRDTAGKVSFVGLHRSGGDIIGGVGFNVATDLAKLMSKSSILRKLTQRNYGPYTVYFEFDHSALTAEAIGTLDLFLQNHENVGCMVMLQGHADTYPSEQYAVGLSGRLNSSVRAYLESKGLGAGSITSENFGKSRPLYAEGNPMNNRVDLLYGPGCGNQ